jgi:hypothetical protein
VQELLAKLVAYLGEQEGGGVLLLHKSDDKTSPWMVSFEFGKEAEDSDMVGGAAYGAAETAEEAVKQVAAQCGLDGESSSEPTTP